MAVDCLKRNQTSEVKGDLEPLNVPSILIDFTEGEMKHYLINSC